MNVNKLDGWYRMESDTVPSFRKDFVGKSWYWWVYIQDQKIVKLGKCEYSYEHPVAENTTTDISAYEKLWGIRIAKIFSTVVCKWDNKLTGVFAPAPLLLDNPPKDPADKNTESSLVKQAAIPLVASIRRNLTSWPVCSNGGTVKLEEFGLHRLDKKIEGIWTCNCWEIP